MIINEEEEVMLREQYQRIAKENGIFLSITYAYFAKEGKGENKHLFIGGDGKILLDYTKRYLLGFGSSLINVSWPKQQVLLKTAIT